MPRAHGAIAVGMTQDRDLDEAVRIARNFKPLTAEEQTTILEKVKRSRRRRPPRTV